MIVNEPVSNDDVDFHAINIAQHGNVAPIPAALVMPKNYPVCQLACHVPRRLVCGVPVAIVDVDRPSDLHQQNLIADVFPAAVDDGSRPADRLANHSGSLGFFVLLSLITQPLTVSVLHGFGRTDNRSASVLLAKADLIVLCFPTVGTTFAHFLPSAHRFASLNKTTGSPLPNSRHEICPA